MFVIFRVSECSSQTADREDDLYSPESTWDWNGLTLSCCWFTSLMTWSRWNTDAEKQRTPPPPLICNLSKNLVKWCAVKLRRQGPLGVSGFRVSRCLGLRGPWRSVASGASRCLGLQGLWRSGPSGAPGGLGLLEVQGLCRSWRTLLKRPEESSWPVGWNGPGSSPLITESCFLHQ